MIGLMIVTENQREQQILSMAFSQHNINTTASAPSYSNYIKVLQYQPDIILLEVPRMSNEQVNFSSLIRKNRKTRKIPIIAYGDKKSDMEKRFLTQKGMTEFIERPLKFSRLLQLIQDYLKRFNKSIDSVASSKIAEKDADIALILDANTLATKKIELMVKHISNLMAFPFTVAKVLRITESSKAGAGDLAKVIEADPVISANILKVSNTVFFASLNRRIGTVKDAIVRVGFKETKRLVMAMSVMQLFANKENGFGFNKMDFWHHSLATALISEQIARRMGDIDTDEAFLAGLLHDFGILLLHEYFPTIFSTILEATTNNGSHFIDNENKILKITHNDLIRELFTTWKMPSTITETIAAYSAINTGDLKTATPVQKAALCLHVGNTLTKIYSFGNVCDEYVAPLENPLFEAIKMPNGIGKDFYERISKELDTFRKFLQIEGEMREPPKEKKTFGIFTPSKTLFVPVEEYLRALGHLVERIPAAASCKSFDRKCDMICVWADQETALDAITPLTRIIQKPVQENDPSQQPSFAPVLVFLRKGSPLSGAEAKTISRMYNAFDLRQLDENIVKVLDNEIIALPGSEV